MKKLLLLFSLLCASLAFGQGVVVAPQTAFKVVNGLTTPIANATITVCAALTGGKPCSPALANSVFSNSALTLPLSNPFFADSTGNYQFAIAPGNYTVTVTSLGFTGQSYQLTVATPISLAGGLGDPGANGVVFRNGLNTTRPAASADVISLWSGACNVGTVLRGDGSCAATLADPGSNGIMKRTALNVTAIAASSDIIALFTGCSGIQYLGADGACHSALSSLAFSGITGGTNTTAAMLVGTGASLAPANIGQVAGNSIWLSPANATFVPNAPTTTISNTGGSLVQNTYFIRLTYVGLGTTVPSAELRQQLNATNCASNATCQITVNMPTSCQAGSLPTGATGCTVWDIAGNNNSDLERQQAASSNCVNITTATCVVNVAAVGSTIASPPNTSGVAPSPFANISQPDFIVPTIFALKGDGNYYPTAGMDYSALNVLVGNPASGWQPPATGNQAGTFTWTDRFFVNDANGAPIISNALVSIHHLAGQTTGTVSTSGGSGVDDRALGVEMIDSATATPFFQQSLTQYNERIITNNSFSCSPISGGSAAGESCAAAGRFVLSDIRPAPTLATASPVVGLAGVASNSTPNGTSIGSCGFPNNPCIAGVQGGAYQSATNQNGQGGLWAGGWFQVTGAGGNTNGSGAGVFTSATHSFASNNYGYLVNGNSTTNGDWNISSYTTTANAGRNYFGGPSDFQQPLFGTVLPSQIATMTNGFTVTNNNCAGAATWIYKVVPKDMAGGFAPATAPVSTSATSCATLDATHTVTVAVNTGGANLLASEVYGRYSVDFYRTTSGGTPASTGYIGTATCNLGGCSLIDNGIAATIPPNDDPGTPPAYNTSGRIAGYTIGTVTNCAAVGTAANPSVASCTAAAAGSFSCATNASAGTCQVNTTAVTGSSEILITQRTDTTTGTRLAVTCNTTVSTVIPVITAVSPGVSFTINLGTITTNPECFSYSIIN